VSFWTTEREDRLRKLWAAGLSCSQIAAELGAVSRCSIIGKVHRLGLPGRGQPKDHACNKATKRVRKPRSVPGRVGHQGTAQAVKLISEPQTQPEESSMGTPAGKHCTIMELNSTRCRWPLWGRREDHGEYCGGKSVGGLPYCLAHCQMAYRPAGERKSQAVLLPVIRRRPRAA
jgi:GcrA cell cycle regulator